MVTEFQMNVGAVVRAGIEDCGVLIDAENKDEGASLRGLVWALALHLLAYRIQAKVLPPHPCRSSQRMPQLAAVDRRIRLSAHSQQQRSLHSNSTRL
jgi:hypothetical protein